MVNNEMVSTGDTKIREEGYSRVRNENTQSAKICLNFNFRGGGGGTLKSELKIVEVPRSA